MYNMYETFSQIKSNIRTATLSKTSFFPGSAIASNYEQLYGNIIFYHYKMRCYGFVKKYST